MVWKIVHRFLTISSCVKQASHLPLMKGNLRNNMNFLIAQKFHSTPALSGGKGKVTVHFLFPDGKKKTIEAKEGSNLLDVVIDHDVDIDGFGACEGTLACSTCHLILPQDLYDKLPPPVDEELDMLDLAYELTDTSRLGCQVVLTKDLDGMEVNVPVGLADARG